MSRFNYSCLLLPLLIPPVVFSGCALFEGLTLSQMVVAVAEQYATRQQNLLICGLLGLFPVLLLLVGLWLYNRRGGDEQTRQLMAWGGLIPILAVLVWVNLQFWPLFLPARTYPGFPHGLEFIIGPVFFAPVAMLFGMAAGWWLGRSHKTS